MKVYIFMGAEGWGKGETLDDAMSQYIHYTNREIDPKSYNHRVMIFEVKSIDDVWIDEFEWHAKAGTIRLA